jgi:hypothetical protein
MPVTTMVLLIVLAVAVMTQREPPPTRRRIAFAAWVVAGFLGAFATISFAIGLLILPLALAAIVGAAVLATRAEVLGLLPGIGAMCLLVVALDIDEGRIADSWLASGLALVAGGGAAYSLARRRFTGSRLS